MYIYSPLSSISHAILPIDPSGNFKGLPINSPDSGFSLVNVDDVSLDTRISFVIILPSERINRPL